MPMRNILLIILVFLTSHSHTMQEASLKERLMIWKEHLLIRMKTKLNEWPLAVETEKRNANMPGYLAHAMQSTEFNSEPVFLDYPEGGHDGFLFAGKRSSLFNKDAYDKIKKDEFVHCKDTVEIKTKEGYKKFAAIIAGSCKSQDCERLKEKIGRDLVVEAVMAIDKEHPYSVTPVIQVNPQTKKFEEMGDLSQLTDNRLALNHIDRENYVTCPFFQLRKTRLSESYQPVGAVLVGTKNAEFCKELALATVAKLALIPKK